jgi:magnesium chelatase subunit I
MAASPRPSTLGELKTAVKQGALPHRSVKDEVRQNLIAKLRRGDVLFPGIIGYEDTVVPQIVNAVLARQNFILLGLRGQAKTRLLRALTSLLDDEIPVVPGSEINDDPLAPLSAYAREKVSRDGDLMRIDWLPREARYVEKLATPDVTIADMIGDIDPIKAAHGGLQLASELAMHFGLLPRANRGMFAINELPDLAGKIQVGLFNILQEGDVQIKGFPVRLPLDVMVLFTANPEDYTARGKIITPLKDRIGAEIRTHYMDQRDQAMAITAQEAWLDRDLRIEMPRFVREIVEEVAFQARQDRRIDKRSGVSQRMPISVIESVTSNAERRALVHREAPVVPRVIDLYAALPAMTGKFELEYEGELKGADVVGRDLIRAAVSTVFDGTFAGSDSRSVVEWFDLGGTLNLGDSVSAGDVIAQARQVQGLLDLAYRAGIAPDAPPPVLAAAIDFVLEGLYSQKKIGRSDERGYHGSEPVRRPTTTQRPTMITADEEDDEPARKKKRYYN